MKEVSLQGTSLTGSVIYINNFSMRILSLDKKVRMEMKNLKGYASLWWDNVQVERRRKSNPLTKSWDRMVAKMRDKFFPRYY